MIKKISQRTVIGSLLGLVIGFVLSFFPNDFFTFLYHNIEVLTTAFFGVIALIQAYNKYKNGLKN